MSLPDGPRANVEIKARLGGPDAAARIAAALGARSMGSDRQVDTYFRVPRVRLKLRESMFAGSQLIPYDRPDVAGPRRADYEVLPAPRGGRTKELFATLLGVEVVVEKVRRLWVLRDTRIHLDTVAGLALPGWGGAVRLTGARPPVDLDRFPSFAAAHHKLGGDRITVAKNNRQAAITSEGAYACALRTKIDPVETARMPKTIASRGGIIGRRSEVVTILVSVSLDKGCPEVYNLSLAGFSQSYIIIN